MAKRKNLPPPDDPDETVDEFYEEPDEAAEESPKEPPEEVVYEDEPTPATPILAIVLGALNILALGTFVYFLFADLERRQSWSFAVFQHDLILYGLPLRSEADVNSAAREVAPKPLPTPEQLRDAYRARKTGVTVNETFSLKEVLVEGPGGSRRIGYEEVVPRIKPQHITKDVFKDTFGVEIGEPVSTQEEEIERVKTKVFDDIARAAQDASVLEKTPADQRKRLEKLLLPLACNIQQVRALDKHIKQIKDSDLPGQLEQAYLRRMMVDLLMPLEYFRPGKVDSMVSEKLGDLAGLKNDEIKEQLRLRLENAIAKEFNPEIHHGPDWLIERGSIERKRAIAFLLFDLSQLKKPDGTPMYPKGPERAQAVVGLWEFAQAAQNYTQAMLRWRERIHEIIEADRQGHPVLLKDEPARTPAFVDQYPDLVDKMRATQREIKLAEKRLAALTLERDKYQKHLKDRQDHLAKITQELIVEREKTAKMMSELNVLQESYFQALRYLADAQDNNVELLKKIQAPRNKGGK